jgi:hypothetical protein
LSACCLRQFVALQAASAHRSIILADVTPSRRPALADLAIVLVLAAIAVVGYRFSPLLLPKADLTLAPMPGCDLHRQSCRVELPDGGAIEFSITPHPIPVIRPLQVEATITDLAADKVEVDFAGIAMDMGYNRITLQPTESGRYVGQATLPVCVTGRMEWLATLMVESRGRHIAVPFRFDAPLI